MHNAQRVGGVGRVKRNPLAQFLLTGCLQQAIQDIKKINLYLHALMQSRLLMIKNNRV